MNFLNKTIRSGLRAIGYDLIKVRPLPSPPAPTLDEFADIPDAALYRPTLSPWLGEGDFKKHYDLAAPRTMVRYQKLVEESLPVMERLEAIMFS